MHPSIVLLVYLGTGVQAGDLRLTDEGIDVTHTRSQFTVKGCEPLGEVKSHPPFFLPSDWKKELRNEAAKLGADTVFGRAGIGSVVGQAYRCGTSLKEGFPEEPKEVGDDVVSKLTALAKLHKSGALTDEEYAAAKAKVLAE